MQTEKQRERLVELIQEGKSHAFCDICEGRSDCENCENERIADYLMSNNVVVLPENAMIDVYSRLKIEDETMLIYEVETYTISWENKKYCTADDKERNNGN